MVGCSISQFITKPQLSVYYSIRSMVVQYLNSSPNHNLRSRKTTRKKVVQYLNSSPNHNCLGMLLSQLAVVQYLNSSPNHNCTLCTKGVGRVVQYLNSSPNHNGGYVFLALSMLFNISIHHQTTTKHYRCRT